MRPALIWSPDYTCDIGLHVFPIQKYALAYESLLADGSLEKADVVPPGEVSRELLAMAHTREYLDDLEALRWTPRTQWSEMPLTREIIDAFARQAAGTTTAAREALTRGVAAHLGGGLHHAFADKAEGFCYLNDLAVAVRAMQHEGRITRAAVVDLDVHQGNGTAHIFKHDARVFTLSIHQERNYPTPKMHSDLDIGLDDGTGDAAYMAALLPALEQVWAHAPELVLYQAGADPYEHDQLGGLALTLAGLAARDAAVIDGCVQRGIPLVTTLGGGYARQVADTARIHATTTRLAIEAGLRGPARVA
jgi:acetoin utilization deacetylase AcuC-like enzyme